MPRKKRVGSDFGQRLVSLRRARGVTQVQLADSIGSTQRAISYYENHADYPPAPVVAAMAKALRISSDELLGLKPSRQRAPVENDAELRRIWRKFQRVLELPEKDQRAVIRLINSLVSARGNHR